MLRTTMAAVGAAIACLIAAGVATAAPTLYSNTVMSGAAGPGNTDSAVQASLDGGTPSPANIINANPMWNTILGTNWDSVYADSSTGAGGVLSTYSANLGLPANATNVTVAGFYLSDNQGTVTAGGTQLAQNADCSADSASQQGDFTRETFFSGSVPAGVGALVFTVQNCDDTATGNPTGVDFTAKATYSLAAVSKADCASGGWQNVTDSNGNGFKNQGDCVSSVASDGKNLAG
jgi:hypothetical protein